MCSIEPRQEARQDSPAGSNADVDWTCPGGTFSFQVCRPAANVLVPADVAISPDIDRAPLISSAPAVHAVTGNIPDDLLESGVGERIERPRSDRLLGILVHRLFQRQLPPDVSASDVAAIVPVLLRPEESVDVGELKNLNDRAAAMYLRLRQHPEMTLLLGSGKAMYEVPFSLYREGSPAVVIRGRIDCVIEHADGAVTILELKTGQFRPEHQAQLDVYREAIEAVLPGRRVEARLVYA